MQTAAPLPDPKVVLGRLHAAVDVAVRRGRLSARAARAVYLEAVTSRGSFAIDVGTPASVPQVVAQDVETRTRTWVTTYGARHGCSVVPEDMPVWDETAGLYVQRFWLKALRTQETP